MYRAIERLATKLALCQDMSMGLREMRSMALPEFTHQWFDGFFVVRAHRLCTARRQYP